MGAITFGHPFKGTIPVVGEVVGTIAASFGVVAGTVAGLLNGIHGALTGMAKTSGRGNMGYRRWREHNTEWRRDINDAEGEIEYPGI